MPPRTFDLIVIGSGSAASTVASQCRSAGWSVAMIDKLPFGGTCALRGCDPKKVLVGATAALEAAHGLAGRGVRSGDLAVDWAALMAFKRTFTEPYPEHKETSLKKKGSRCFTTKRDSPAGRRSALGWTGSRRLVRWSSPPATGRPPDCRPRAPADQRSLS